VCNNIGILLQKQQQTAESLFYFQKAVSIDAADSVAMFNMVLVQLQLSLTKNQPDLFNRAIEKWLEFRKFSRNTSAFYNNLLSVCELNVKENNYQPSELQNLSDQQVAELDWIAVSHHIKQLETT